MTTRRAVLFAATLPGLLLVGACSLFDDSPNSSSHQQPAATNSMSEPAAPPTEPAAPMAVSTEQYVSQAALADMLEIQSSHIALKMSKNKDVQTFAQMMIKDHTASSKKMKTILAKGAAPGAVAPAAIDAEHKAKLDELKTTPAASFDAAYMKLQTEGHTDALKLHQTYAASGDNPALKALAEQITPIVQKHLESAQQLEQSMGAKPVSSNQ